jgi:ATP-dependent RNA helicase DDX19/DBP5
MLWHIDLALPRTQALAIFNTRELTLQTFDVFKKLNVYQQATGGVVMGTDRRGGEVEALPPPTTQVLFATPRALGSELKRKKFDLTDLKIFVVDEADEVMGARSNQYDDVKLLLDKFIPKAARKAFFSATYADDSTAAIKAVMAPNAITLTLKPNEQKVRTVSHWAVLCKDDDDAFDTLKTLYTVKRTGQTVVFVQNQVDAPWLAERLNKAELRCEWFGGQRNHAERLELIRDFRDGVIKVLITTDVLSRGFDVPATFLVVNWTPPMRGRNTKAGEQVHAATYYHRAGRAGRFGRTGICFTFVRSAEELRGLRGACGQYGIELKSITKEKLGDLPEEQIVAELPRDPTPAPAADAKPAGATGGEPESLAPSDP